ncbi:MAG TPA: ATP-binding protein [Humisphaera sp.]
MNSDRTPPPPIDPPAGGQPFDAPPRGMTLRGKLRLGFGGLLVILLSASGIGAAVLTHYAGTFDRIFHENYDSVLYCEGMKDALDGLDHEAERLIWAGGGDRRRSDELARAFDDNLARQARNCYLPGERARTDAVATDWAALRADFDGFHAAPAADRAAAYRDVLLPRNRALWAEVQAIREMNLRNMVDTDGQVRSTLLAARSALVALAAAGSTLAVVFVVVVGPRMLRPLSELTRSAGLIADGQLDLSVGVPRAGDEVGQLAAAFNTMAGRLREFRRADRDRLARTEQTTQMAIDSLPDAVTVLSPAGDVELANRVARERFGVAPGRAADGAARPDWMTALHAAVMETGRSVEPRGYAAALQRFDGGDERFYLPHATPLLSGDGRVVGVTAILTDVTRLRQADEAKSDLVSTVSHELKTPLTGIAMAAGMLADPDFGPLSDRQAPLVDLLRTNAARLSRTIENLLGISRIESGRVPLSVEPMPVADVVRQAVEPLRAQLAERSVGVAVDLPAEPAAVLADPQCVGYVLTNLLANAGRFAPPGSAVRVRCEPGPETTSFTVADDGPGIAAAHVPRLFDRFFRVPRDGAPAGAGLGLAIARDVVEAHGGSITVDTAEGGGARFTFTLRSAPIPRGSPQ